MKIKFCLLIFAFFNFYINNVYAISHEEKLPKRTEARIKEKCLQKAGSLVELNYNFKGLKIEKYPFSELANVCNDHKGVAGCFTSTMISPAASIDFTNIEVGTYKCVVPKIKINFDFPLSFIYLNDEYKGCNLRVVFRHELQHFLIWKTTQNQLIKETYFIINDMAKNDICIADMDCNKNYEEIYQMINKIYHKWDVIHNKNDKALDDTDHDGDKQVNYVVCDKKNQFNY